MANKSALILDHLKKEYPMYRPVRVHEFQRQCKKQKTWVSSVGRTEFWQFADVKAQIKAVIDSGALKVCFFLRNFENDQALLSNDIDIEKFIKSN